MLRTTWNYTTFLLDKVADKDTVTNRLVFKALGMLHCLLARYTDFCLLRWNETLRYHNMFNTYRKIAGPFSFADKNYRSQNTYINRESTIYLCIHPYLNRIAVVSTDFVTLKMNTRETTQSPDAIWRYWRLKYHLAVKCRVYFNLGAIFKLSKLILQANIYFDCVFNVLWETKD